jgi:hypothetical protein
MGAPFRFSVGIPTRNQAEFLPATLDSLLSQRRPPDEIVISDHASTDSTPEIVAQYVSQHPGLIRGVRPPEGCGVSGQWRFTLGQLTGDWITLLSSDDIAYPQFCQVLLTGAVRRPDAVLVRAAWENIDGAGKVLSQQYMLSIRSVTLPPANLLEQRYGPKASFAAFAVRREALDASGGYPEGLESFGDWPMFAQLAPFGSFIYEPQLISGYRTGHDGNKFRTRFGMWVRDEQRMFGQVLPLAAERLGMRTHKQRAWIAEASHANFLRYLTAASKEFAAEERTPLLADLGPWAASVGESAALNRFAAGERVTQRPRAGDVLRHLLRPMVHRIAHSLARR